MARMRTKAPKKSHEARTSAVDSEAASLEAYEKWKIEMLPAIQRDLKAGLPAHEILQKYKAIAAARKVMALVSQNEDTAIRAAQQILDRTEGKAKEKVEHTHKYESLSDEELEAKLRSLEAENEADTVRRDN